MNNTLEYTIKVLDQYGNPIKDFNESIGKSTKNVKGLDDALLRIQRKKSPYDTHNRSLEQLRQNVARCKQAADKSFRADHIKRYNILIDETNKKIKQLEGTTQTCAKKTEGFFDKIKNNFGISKGLLIAAPAIKGLQKLGQFAYSQGMESIKAASEVEKYNVTLKTMLGTTDKARERMQEYFDIAKKTPFDLPQVVEAGNKLQALGRYSRDNVVMLGDLAAASGKPMEQAMSAFSKLASGQKGIAIDMFRDLMITTADWTKATAKGISKNGELLATTEELIAALPKIMKSKGFFGMMANQAETTEGKVANLGDAVFQLRAAFGEKLQPAYNKVVETTTQAIEKFTKIVEIPVEQKIAREKVELNALVESLMDANVKGQLRNDIIEKLQQKYPDFIKNIDLEKASTEELRKELEKTNLEYDKKIRLASYKRRVEQLEDEMEQSGVKILDYEMAIQAKNTYFAKREELRKFINSKGIGYSQAESYSVDKQGRIFAKVADRNGMLQKVYVSSGLNETDKTTAIGLYSEMTQAEKLIKIKPEKGLEKEKEKYKEYNYKRQIIDGIYKQEQQVDYEQILKKASEVNISNKDVYAKLFGKGKNAAELAKEFDTLIKTPLDQLDDAKIQRIQQFMGGGAYNSSTPIASPTSPSSANTVGGKSSSISAGGTRSTSVNITLGNMVENMNFNGTMAENQIDIERQLMQILSRVLGMAAVS